MKQQGTRQTKMRRMKNEKDKTGTRIVYTNVDGINEEAGAARLSSGSSARHSRPNTLK